MFALLKLDRILQRPTTQIMVKLQNFKTYSGQKSHFRETWGIRAGLSRQMDPRLLLFLPFFKFQQQLLALLFTA